MFGGFANVYTAIIALFGAMIFVVWLNETIVGSPKLGVLGRWLRCAAFSLAIAAALGYFLPDYGFWLLLLVGFMAYFLGDSLLAWLNISLINYSDYAPFAPFKEVETSWSAQKGHLALKRKIEALGFKKAGSLKSSPVEGADVMVTVFDSPDKKTRLTVAFLPALKVTFVASAAVSVGEDGEIFYTEANPTPFGLAYPDNYNVERHPMVSNPLRLLKIHERRAAASKKSFTAIEESAGKFINESLEEIRKTGIREGLVNPVEEIEEEGLFTSEGRYGIWKDMLAMAYLPFIIRK